MVSNLSAPVDLPSPFSRTAAADAQGVLGSETRRSPQLIPLSPGWPLYLKL